MNIDVLIRGGEVIDGSEGAEPRRADVAIADDRIVDVGILESATATTVIDASDRYVCPGFIDTHVHSEAALLRDDERWWSLIQGVTTHLGGPDGFGWAGLAPDAAAELWRSTIGLHGEGPPDEAPVGARSPAEWLERYRGRLPLDLVPMIPHLPLRFAAMGWSTDEPGPAEMARMKEHAEAWLAEGAAAFAVGLDYPPSTAATTDELAGIATLLAPLGLRYVAHGRFRRLGAVGSYRDDIEIGRRAGVGVVISHSNVDDEFERILEEAREEGIDVAFDSHLYPAGCTHLLFNVPEADQADGVDALLARLDQEDERRRIERHFDEVIRTGWAEGAREIIASTGSGRRAGEYLADVAEREGVTPGELAVSMLREERADVLLVYMWAPWGGDEAAWAPTVQRTLSHPDMIVASDGLYRPGAPHPRGYGTFARTLGIVRDRAVVSWGEAIHKMTGKPADVYGLRDRGRLAPGLTAHAVVFDPATVGSRATWEQPHQAPVGVETVVVNGRVAVSDGQPTGILAGRTARALA